MKSTSGGVLIFLATTNLTGRGGVQPMLPVEKH
jgi:hypothetical protein